MHTASVRVHCVAQFVRSTVVACNFATRERESDRDCTVARVEVKKKHGENTILNSCFMQILTSGHISNKPNDCRTAI